MWRVVLDQAADDLSLVFYRWFVQHMEERTWAYGTGDLEKFLFTYAWRGKLRNVNMEILDARIQDCIESEKEYGLEQLLLWREDMMKWKGCSPEEIRAFYQQYWDKPFVRDRIVEGYLEAGEQEKAIALLQEGKRIDRDNTWQMARHSEKLIELYELTGQVERYREELRFRVCSCYLRDLTYVKRLRETLTEAEWEILLRELLRLRTADAVRYELLAYGERWQQLFEMIRDKQQLELMQRYAAAMCSWSAETVMECYTDMLKTAMRHASERREYRCVIGYLSGLRACPDGERAAEKVASYWKETYPKRSAMLQELETAGYR